jgi:hypothetical protein
MVGIPPRELHLSSAERDIESCGRMIGPDRFLSLSSGGLSDPDFFERDNIWRFRGPNPSE